MTPMPTATDQDEARPAPLSYAPDDRGRFGEFGGRFVPETLIAALTELEELYREMRGNAQFWDELRELNRTFIGRPTAFQRAAGLTREASSRAQREGRNKCGATIWLKREDLAHTGAHKINNTIGQGLLTRKMGKRRVIAETGAGQHGVATATAAARLGLECDIYMGSEDIRRQHLNVIRMKMLGARIIPVDSGSRTLKDATNEAMRDWMGSVEHTHYILGSVVGPHPFPMIVRDFQSVIGRETKAQALRNIGAMPDYLIACVGGGSNAAGFFYPFVDDNDVRLVGVEAGGRSDNQGDHAAPLRFGKPGVLHGSMSYVLQNEDGQTSDVHSCSAGLDYPGVGPEHSFWKDTGRAEYTSINDGEALDAFMLMARAEGIIPALETSHAVAHAVRLASELPNEQNVIINVSGRGDKDVEEALRLMGGEVEPTKARAARQKRKKKKKNRDQGNDSQAQAPQSDADGSTDEPGEG